MSDALAKLASIGSSAIFTPPLSLEAGIFTDCGQLGDTLFSWLSKKNGFYAFESAIHLFPVGSKAGIIDLKAWNSPTLWKDCYADLTEGQLFFAEDVFGNQFCIDRWNVGSFDAETGEITRLAGSLEQWAQILLAQYELYTGHKLAHEWQERNGILRPGTRLIPKTPFVTGGEYALGNLHAIESVRGMRFRGDLARQIRDLPDGTPIHYKVV